MSFTTNRKLQSEIDKCLKKIADGVDDFDELHDMVRNQGMKDKFDDLKRDIKKLQKLRDQVKNYISMSDVKNKQPLIDQRKLIESKMESFKHCERETKTKAYSKEGLAAAAARGDEDKNKTAQREYLNRALASLKEQIEKLDFEIETASNSRKKKGDVARTNRLAEFVERHQFHVRAIEKTLRLLENESVSPEQVEEMQDDLDYYLESNQEPDFFYDDEQIYEPVGLDREDILRADDAVSVASRAAAALDDQIVTRSAKAAAEAAEAAKAEAAKIEAAKAALVASAGVASSPPKSGGIASSPKRSNTTAAAVVAKSPKKDSSKKLSKATQQAAASPTNRRGATNAPADTKAARKAKTTTPALPMAAVVAAAANRASANKPGTAATAATAAAAAPAPSAQNAPQGSATAGAKGATASTSANTASASATSADAEPAVRDWASTALLHTALQLLPEAPSSSSRRNYVARQPTATPAFYPQTPHASFDVASTFEKFDTDTLFFVFYYQQGTYQQFLAARELKKKAWRYHKKYLTWFQRHEEPKEITSEMEKGTYVYFDYETGWCQRKKTEFTFEYRFLEDS